jgi:heme O synthase-like polyprenyltransferase
VIPNDANDWRTFLPSSELFAAALIPALRSESGIVYHAGVLILKGAFHCYSARFALRMSTVSARQLLFTSVLDLPVLFAWLALARNK